MANRQFRDAPHTFEKQPVILNGVLTMTGTGPNTFTSDVKGFSVAATGTGEFTITLDDKYTALLNCMVSVEAGTAADLVPQIESEDVSGAKTIVIAILAGAVKTDLGASDKLRITIYLRNSTAP